MESTFQLFIVEAIRQYLPEIVQFVVLVLLVPLGRASWQYIKSRLSASQIARVQSIIRTLVLAAEQSKFKDSLGDAAANKKAWVLSEAQRTLRELGLSVLADNVPLLTSILEAEVYTNLNSGLALIEAGEITTLPAVESV
jgi:hypothetical protein